MTTFFTRSLSFFIAIFIIMPSHSKEIINFSNKAFKEIISIADDGTQKITLVKPDLALPKDNIVYITTFTNIGKDNASNIVITNPIPNNSVYIAGSATGKSCEITFSIDNGKNYAAPNKLSTKNSKGEWLLAEAKDYTTVRWVYKKELSKSESSFVAFKTYIK